MAAGLARARRAAPKPRGAAQRVGQLRRSLHRLQRLLALARHAADRPVLAPDRLHDHRPQQAEPGLPDVGDAAARHGLRDDMVGKVAPEPATRTRRSQPYGFSGGTYPFAQRQLPGRAPRWTRRSSISSRIGSTSESGRRAVVHDGLAGQPPRRRLVVPLHERNPAGERTAGVGQPDPAELRDSRGPAGARQAAAAPLAAGDRRPLVRRRAVLRSRIDRDVERPDEHVPAAAELRRPADRPRARKARLPSRG